MPKNFKNMDILARYLRKKVSSALENEVSTVIKRVMQEHTESDIYAQWEPSMYVRRSSNGGLGDIDNMETELLDNMTLMLTNTTLPNTKYRYAALRGHSVPEAVETGNYYQFFSPGPRPFVRNTANELRRRKQHIAALIQGLRRQGLDIK